MFEIPTGFQHKQSAEMTVKMMTAELKKRKKK